MKIDVDVDRVVLGVPRAGSGAEGDRIARARLQFAEELLRDAPATEGVAPRLLWRVANGGVRVIPITRPLTLGSDPGCDVVFSSPGVSPMHCLLGPSGVVHEIVDLGSASGTFVNVTQVGRTLSPLADGDLIQLGAATVLFVE